MDLIRYDIAKPTREQRADFRCGEESLDRWLATQAGQSMASRDAVTYLLLDGGVIAGYYCLSAGQVRRSDAAAGIAKRAPDPIPAVRMGRFAIHRDYQGQRWGGELLREALLGAVAAISLMGGRVMLVDAISDGAKAFYLRYGFQPSPIHPMQLMYDLREVEQQAGLRPAP